MYGVNFYDRRDVVPDTFKEKEMKKRIFAIIFIFGILVLETFNIIGCTSTAHFQPREEKVDPGILQRLNVYGQIKFLGKNQSIRTFEYQVSTLRQLIGNTTVSITPQNMPLELEKMLKSLRTNDNPHGNHDDYGTYYDFVIANVDRILICPDLIVGNARVGGVSLSLDGDILYPNEHRVIMINSYNNIFSFLGQTRGSKIIFASTVVHEAAHQEIARLWLASKIPDVYFPGGNGDERYAHIRQQEFLLNFNRNPDANRFEFKISDTIRILTREVNRHYNQYGINYSERYQWFPD